MSDAARTLLHEWLLRQLEATGARWLEAQIAALRQDPADAALDFALGMIPRRLGKAGLALTGADLAAAGKAGLDAPARRDEEAWRAEREPLLLYR
jgi:hypothetical protein